MTPASAPGSHICSAVGGGRDDGNAAIGGIGDKSLEHHPVILVRRAQAEVDEVRAGVDRPSDRRHQRGTGRDETPIENLHRHQLSLGRLFVNGRCHRRAVTEPIHGIGVLRSSIVERHTGADAADVRVIGMDAAVDHRDAHAAAGPSGERRQRNDVYGIRHHCARGAGVGHAEQRGKLAGSALELRRRAALNDTRAVEHDRRVGGPDQIEPMRNQDRRPAAHDTANPVDDLPLGDRIQRGARFVEHEHGRVGQKRSSERQPLALAGRHRQAAITHDRSKAVGQPRDKAP